MCVELFLHTGLPAKLVEQPPTRSAAVTDNTPSISELLDQLKAAFGSSPFAVRALLAATDFLMRQPATRRKAAAALLRDVAAMIERGAERKL